MVMSRHELTNPIRRYLLADRPVPDYFDRRRLQGTRAGGGDRGLWLAGNWPGVDRQPGVRVLEVAVEHDG
jgi:hypothetical protein